MVMRTPCFSAGSGQLEISQRHPDIYAVPVKTAKLDYNRPQPIGSSSGPEPLTLLSSKEGSPFYTSEEEAVAGYYTADSYQYQDTEL
uniref:Uncharacterized protein n=1 Tax=Larimichthys crocea TaxID=215358 RepID=A0A0F8BXN8_LARCR